MSPHERRKTSTFDYIDVDTVMQRADGDAEVALDLAELAAEQAIPLIGRLRRSSKTRDVRELTRAARTLRGALRGVGAEEVARATRDLETMARDGEFSALRGAVTAVERSVVRVVAELRLLITVSSF